MSTALDMNSLVMPGAFMAFCIVAFTVSLWRILNSPMTDAAKGIWVLIVLVVPIFGSMLSFAFVPDRIANDQPK